MDYNNIRIDYNEIEKSEIDKIFPIFRFRKVAMIFMLVFLFVPLIYSLIVSVIVTAKLGVLSSAGLVFLLIATAIEVGIFLFLYKSYVDGNMTVVWIAFAILVILSIIAKSWISFLFYIWLAVSIWLTNKAKKEAQRKYDDLREAQRYSQEKETRKTMSNPASYQNQDVINGKADPIDNSNIFANNNAVNLVSMDSVFKKPEAATTDIPKNEFSPDASSNTAEETIEEATTEIKAEAKSDVPSPVEGSGGLRYCPKCTFSLLPNEAVCPRCNK